VIIEAGQVAVVTGAAQGLGHALAAGFIDRGVSVVLADTATERLHSTAEAFTALGARVLPVITDVSDATAVTALASRALEHFGRVDMVVARQWDAPVFYHNEAPAPGGFLDLALTHEQPASAGTAPAPGSPATGSGTKRSAVRSGRSR